MNNSAKKHLRSIAKSGGIARNALHGNPGTIEGRRRGGRNSVRAQRTKNTGFRLRTKILHPKDSPLLAELLGVLVGDGHLSPYHMSVTTNSVTDRDHARFVQHMIFQLFGVRPKIIKRKGVHAIAVIVTAKNLVDFLHKKGMPIGNKLLSGLSIPKWIFEKDAYLRAFLRGLFDTDGSVYRDHRTIKGKKYFGTGLLLSSASETLRKEVLLALSHLEFRPTGGEGKHRSIYLRKRQDIVRYFREIGTSNPKHLGRFKSFTGGVA